MGTARYTVVLVPDRRDGGYVASVPVVGVTTQGETIDEALAMAAEAAGGRLEVLAEDGEWLPTEAPGAIVGSVEVRLGESSPLEAATKLEG